MVVIKEGVRTTEKRDNGIVKIYKIPNNPGKSLGAVSGMRVTLHFS